MSLKALFLQACRLAHLVTQEVELAATDLAVRQHFDLVDLGRVNGNRTLDSDTERDLADRERLAVTGAVTTNDDALEHLGALARTFDDLVVDLDAVSDGDHLEILANLLLL